MGEDLEELRLFNPAMVSWRQELVPALAALDRAAEARPIIAEGEDRARAFGAPHVIGAMLRARSSIETKRRGIQTLRESVAALEKKGPAHELAHSCLELGAALRRTGERSESREPLRRALELAHVSGADGLARRTREELAAVGSRPRRVFRTGVDSLTASELRTAKLAAEGLRNVEIAQRLFVTEKTVEKHLSNTYTKLEIRSSHRAARGTRRVRLWRVTDRGTDREQVAPLPVRTDPEIRIDFSFRGSPPAARAVVAIIDGLACLG